MVCGSGLCCFSPGRSSWAGQTLGHLEGWRSAARAGLTTRSCFSGRRAAAALGLHHRVQRLLSGIAGRCMAEVMRQCLSARLIVQTHAARQAVADLRALRGRGSRRARERSPSGETKTWLVHQGERRRMDDAVAPRGRSASRSALAGRGYGLPSGRWHMRAGPGHGRKLSSLAWKRNGAATCGLWPVWGSDNSWQGAHPAFRIVSNPKSNTGCPTPPPWKKPPCAFRLSEATLLRLAKLLEGGSRWARCRGDGSGGGCSG